VTAGTAALGFTHPPPLAHELHLLHRWLDSWPGLGDIAVGMARQDFDLQLTKYAERGWRANFYPSGLAHSIVKGTAFGETSWRAVQQAAWVAVNKSEERGA